MSALLITGTDTDVGKTVLTTALAAYWQAHRRDPFGDSEAARTLGLMKLMQTGVGDRESYHQLFGNGQGIDIVTPLCFQTPVAPPIAAEREGKTIDLKAVWQAFCGLQQRSDFVLVEALGGLGSPVSWELTVADLAREWRLPVVLVVAVKLGAIAQAVANVALARQAKVKLKGIVLSCVKPVTEQELADWTPIDLIELLTQVPVLGIIPHLSELQSVEKLAQVAANLDLERLLPIFYSRY